MKPEGPIPIIWVKAQELKLEFLVAGGHAVISHGAPRNTFDLDLVISREERTGWVNLMTAIGYSIFSENPNFAQFSYPEAAKMSVDLILVSHETFEKLMAAAVPAPSFPLGVKVVSLMHLLAMKCHAIKFGHLGRLEKDLNDVILLLKSNSLDLNQAEIKEVILKHGTPELYEKLARSI